LDKPISSTRSDTLTKLILVVVVVFFICTKI
jgi:hypothetical protein